jgi:hypothetical protein
MTTGRSDYETASKSVEELADLLTTGMGDSRAKAADAELRLRAHRLLEEQSKATVKYTRYTFHVALWTGVVAGIAFLTFVLGTCR